MDGFIEVYNYMTGKLRKDLIYQAEDNMIIHESACLCLAFSNDSKLLAAGCQDGSINVWDIISGKAKKIISNAHTQGVSSIAFSKDRYISEYAFN